MLFKHGRCYACECINALRQRTSVKRMEGENLLSARTLRLVPDFLRFAQSSGPWPGAKATLRETLGGAFVVVGGRASKPPEDGTPSVFALLLEGGAGPGRLEEARAGKGGGGMRSESVRILGTSAMLGVEDMRWALLMLGNAGEESSCSGESPRTVSASSLSSSSSSVMNAPGSDMPVDDLKGIVLG